MKIARIATIAACAALSACATSVTTDQLNATMAQAATLIANGCKVVQPTVSGVATTTGNSTIATGAAINGVFCAANEAAAAPAAASAPAAK
jgi:hypothetical protein